EGRGNYFSSPLFYILGIFKMSDQENSNQQGETVTTDSNNTSKNTSGNTTSPAIKTELEIPDLQEPAKPDELTLLKQRAKTMGIIFSNNIGLETLKEKIAEKQAETEKAAENATAAQA